MASTLRPLWTGGVCVLLVVAVVTAGVGVAPVAAVTPASGAAAGTPSVTAVEPTSGTAEGPALAVSGGVVAQTDTDTVNYTTPAEPDSNRSVRYVDPESLSTTPPRATSLERAGLQLAESLGLRLEVSANELVEQDYDAASTQLGPAYQSDVVRLTEITEATENASDEELAAALASAGANQRGAVDTAEEFRTLYTTYQQARADQNTTRARQVAQELAATTAELNQTSGNLTAAYTELAALNETQAERAQQRIEQALAQAERISTNAQQSTYIETNVTITSVSPVASPHRPLVISGRLTDVNGTALANQTVELNTPAASPRTRTAADGTFRIVHTPTQLPATDTPLTVRYVPREAAGYLGNATTTTTAAVVGRTPTVSLTSVPSTLANGSTATVTGQVRVDDRAVAGVPVRVRLDGTVIGTTTTTRTEPFAVPIAVPLTAAAGSHTLTVEAGGTGQAVGLTQQQRTVTIEPVETDVEMTVTRSNNTTVAVDGQLTRRDGDPIGAQLLPVSVGEQSVGYVQTDARGRFASEFTLTRDHPAIDGTEQTVPVRVQFTDPTTHLASATATSTVTFFPVPGVFGFGIPAVGWALGGVGVVGLLGGGLVVWWYRDDAAASEPEQPLESMSASPPAVDTESPTASPETLFERADSTVESAPAQAVQIGYLAARRALATDLDGVTTGPESSTTHWEFYRAVAAAEAVDEELTAAFESLTDVYERCTYTTAEPTPDDVQSALQPVQTQLDNSG